MSSRPCAIVTTSSGTAVLCLLSGSACVATSAIGYVLLLPIVATVTKPIPFVRSSDWLTVDTVSPQPDRTLTVFWR
jgi:hypothetical protein